MLQRKGTMAGQDLPPHVLSEVNAHVASLRPQIQQVALQVLDGVNVSAVADRALESMDENCDGKVTRDEFLGSFISVMTDVRTRFHVLLLSRFFEVWLVYGLCAC